MDQKSKRYTTLYRHLNDDLREILRNELENLALSYQQNLIDWYKETYSEILGVKKDDEDRKNRLTQILSRKVYDLKTVLDHACSQPFTVMWQEVADRVASKVPDVIEEVQAEERFIALPADSLKVRFFKKGKSFVKAVSGRNEWTQHVKLQEVVQHYMLSEHEQAGSFMTKIFCRMATSVEMLLEQEMAEGEAEGHRLKVTDDIEKHLEQAIHTLENRKDEIEAYVDEQVKEIGALAEISGTLEGGRKTGRIGEILHGKQERWREYLISQYSDFALQVELARFMRSSDQVRETILKQTHQFYRDSFYLPVERAMEKMKQVKDLLKQHKGGALSKKLVGEIQKAIEADVIGQITDQINRKEQAENLRDHIQRSIADLQIGFSGFSETITLAEERSIEDGAPHVKPDKIKWQKMAARYITEKALREMEPFQAKWDELIDQAVSEVQEAFQIIEVNLLTAKESEEENQDEESSETIASDGTERAMSQLQSVIAMVRENQNSYEKSISENLPRVIDSLVGIMLSRSYSELEMKDKALQVKAAALNWREILVSRFYKGVEKGEILFRYLSPKILKIYKAAARFLGFEKQGEVSTAEKRNLAEYLANVRSGKEYPYVYRRLFSFDFDIDKRFYSPPEHLFKHFEQSITNWRQDLDTNFLITGERGSGKSLAIRFATDKFLDGEKLIRTEFDKTLFTEKELVHRLSDALGFEGIEQRSELIEKIQNRRTRDIFVVENIHNTFVRNIHGYEAIEAFWEIMTSTRTRLFWIVSSSAFAWSHFEKVFGADQFFSHIVRSDRMDRKELESSIMSRHKSTGYEVIFEPGPATQKTRAYKKIVTDEVKVQEYLRDQYFTRLDKISEGNFSIAQIYWMQSIKEFTKKEVIQQPTEIADLDKLEIPSREVLFTLAALILHECLSDREMAMALHQELTESRLMLARLKSKGIVELTENGYRLNHLVYRQVVRLLKKRNIIH